MKYFLLFSAAVFLLSAISAFDKKLRIRRFTIKSRKLSDIPIKIMVISDMHMRADRQILTAVKSEKPDIIALCGDVLDERQSTDKKYEKMIGLLRELKACAPIYSVCGNHDLRADCCEKYMSDIEKIGIVTLENRAEYYIKNGVSFCISGIADPMTRSRDKSFSVDDSIFIGSDGDYKLMLYHRATFSDKIAATFKPDLLLTGHVHGGQWRIPFWRGILSPERSFFPKYEGGMYRENETHIAVCRGSGSAPFLPRIFNPPEVMLLTLEKENTK